MQAQHKAPPKKRQGQKARTPNRRAIPKRQALSAPESVSMKKQLTDARQAPFVWFDIALDDAGLSAFEFRLYCHFARRTGGGKTYFFETLKQAGEVCKMSISSTQRALRVLEKRHFVKLISAILGAPRVYAIADKEDWLPPLPKAKVGHTDRGGSVTQTEGVGHTDRGGSVTQTDRRIKKQKHEEGSNPAAAAPVPAAAAAGRARANENTAATAAKSEFTETLILDYLEERKPNNQARNPGLAHKLWLTGEDDHLIARWQQKQAAIPAVLEKTYEMTAEEMDYIQSKTKGLS